MKKIIFFCLFFAIQLGAFAQRISKYKIAYYVDGCWGQYQSKYGALNITSNSISECSVFANHPSQYQWKVNYSNSQEPFTDNQRLLRDGRVEFRGTVEYYITDECQDIKTILLNDEWIDPTRHNVARGETPCVKRVVPATIRVEKKTSFRNKQKGYNFWGNPKYEIVEYNMYTYNIFFENVGFGIVYIVE